MQSLITELYRAPGSNLVFVRNEKCASTYYAGLFRANNWQPQRLADVDWERDHVFSFIRDPLIRHIKGLVEDMIMIGCEIGIVNNSSKNFWVELPWLGLHSMPISIKFGELADKINWIPLDAYDFNSEDVVKDLLKEHNIDLVWYDNLFRRKSDKYHEEIYNKILIPSLHKMGKFRDMCTDYEIYYKALDRYNISRDQLHHPTYLT